MNSYLVEVIMKKKAIYIILFFMYSQIINSEESIFDGLEYYRVTTNYNGSSYNGNTILVYGEAGIIVRSDNLGKTWEQINLDDKLNIMSITNIGKTFFGAINKKYIIKSEDNGITWKFFDFGDSTYFYKITEYKGNLICISNKSIIFLNQNLEIIKEYKLNYDTTNFDFAVKGSILLFVTGKGKLDLINLENENKDEINLRNLNICSDCPLPYNLIADSNYFYFKLGNVLYRIIGAKVEKILTFLHPGIIITDGNDIYHLHSLSYIDDPINRSNLDSLFFLKIDKISKTVKQINNKSVDRYISGLTFKHLNFITQDLLVAVGNDKLIYFSNDKGKNWELKSHYNPVEDWGKIFIFDKYNARIASKYMKFIATKDGGATWLPQKNYDMLYTKNPFFNFPENTFFSNKNNGFVFFYPQFTNDTTIGYTVDGCETVKLKNDTFGVIYQFHYLDNIFFNCYNKSFLSITKFTQDAKVITNFYLINDSAKFQKYNQLDSLGLAGIINNKDTLYSLAINYNNGRKMGYRIIWDSLYYSIFRSIDTGKTWVRMIDFKLPDLDLQDPVSNSYLNSIFSLNNNFIISYSYKKEKVTYIRIYCLNLYDLELNQIMDKKYITANFFGFGNKIFMVSPSSILVNNNIRLDPLNWKLVGPYERYSNFQLFEQNNKMIYIKAYDSLFKSTAIWFAKQKETTNVIEVEKENNNDLYLSYPVPNPAQHTVKTRIYWNNEINIDKATIEIYDIFGNIVTKISQLNITKINSYSADLTLDISNYQNGIYFIVVRIKKIERAVPLVIIK